MFAVDGAVLAYMIAAGTERYLTLGQAFVGVGWTAGFIGLLGFYPTLAHRRRWVSKAGAIAAGIGAVTMAGMAVAALAYYTGLLAGTLEDVAMYFLPGVFIGIIIGFGVFGVASLATTVYARSIGLLFLLLPVTFLFNLGTGIAGFNPLPKILGVVIVLTLTMLAIGYLLRTGDAMADHPSSETPRDAVV